MRAEKVGFFRELSRGDGGGENLKSHASKGDESRKEQIAEYLDRGSVVAAATRVLFDVLDEECPAICSLSVLTDGVWLWPSDLSYYVRECNVRLPGRFVRHAEATGWVPMIPGEEELDEIEEDFMGSSH
ncbi:hypothetical protein [Nocardiopsis sp. FIRDI 009]|uniref:hypothetical protein n=1 Tax=Nocardiopsis sp. FIRDI 009 TaxID=714197 RepID=UPI0013002DC9|nr:hypothetical protein [Nocardiopsis sp. FIRDI 009]